MSFFQKTRAWLQKIMKGCRGADELSLALLVFGLILTFVSSFTGIGLLYLVGLASYGFSIFRMFSRKIEKRYAENVKFTTFWRKATGEVKQSFNRLKNVRSYKYFKCPQCRSRLRLPRKVGEVTVTCGKCHHAFKQKA